MKNDEKDDIFWREREFAMELLDLLPTAAFWKNTQSIFLGCNKRFAELAGLDNPQDIIGKSDFDMPWGEHQAALYRADDQAVLSTRTPKLDIEEAQTLADGTQIILLTSKIPLFNKDNTLKGILGIFHDITARKQLELSLSESKEKAEAANVAKSDFIANMSHDLRTPLSGIIGMTDIINEYVNDAIGKSCIKDISDCATQLLNLLNQVLELITHPKGDEQLKVHQSFSLQALLDDLAALELPMIHVKGLDFSISIDPDIPTYILSDRLRLERILLNLLGNAIKFTHKGGIYLTVQLVSRHAEGATLKFVLKDTGIGIPYDLQPTVFERFVRGTPSYTGNYQGHGLGLHIVSQYVTALEGEIALTSVPQEGTTITIVLPVMCDDTPKQPVLLNPQSTPTRNVTETSASSNHEKSDNSPLILLVEDNHIALHIAELILKKAGYSYITAVDGLSAFEAVQQNNVNMIFSDIGLPDMSGIELAAHIRAWEKEAGKRPIPIAGLSAHTTDEARETALQAGMNCVVAKPLTMTLLTQLISDLSTPSLTNTSHTTKLVNDAFNLDAFPLLDHEAGITMLGSPQVLSDMLAILINEEIPNSKKELAEIYAVHNREKLHALSHKLKSGAIYCGTKRLQQACQMLESYLNGSETEHDDALYHQLLTVIDHTEATVNMWLSNYRR